MKVGLVARWTLKLVVLILGRVQRLLRTGWSHTARRGGQDTTSALLTYDVYGLGFWIRHAMLLRHQLRCVAVSHTKAALRHRSQFLKCPSERRWGKMRRHTVTAGGGIEIYILLRGGVVAVWHAILRRLQGTERGHISR